MDAKAINRFGVDTNHLEVGKKYTLHTKDDTVVGSFQYATANHACFLTLDGKDMIECIAPNIAAYAAEVRHAQPVR